MGQWLADFRWAMNVMRARRWRRNLSFDARIRFDIAIRPYATRASDGPDLRIMYPDALYHITIDDLTRAMLVAYERDR